MLTSTPRIVHHRPTVHIMSIGRLFAQERAVDVIGPHGSEGADIARHPGHEPGDQGGNAQAEQAGAQIAGEHEGQYFVVTVASRGDRLPLTH